MKTLRMVWLAPLALAIVACGGEKKEDSKVAPATKAKQLPKTYTLYRESSNVLWTGYKLTDKVGVNGKFTVHQLSGKTQASSLDSLLIGQMISIPVSSLDSKDAARDKKIKEVFFGALNTDTIHGVVTGYGPSAMDVDLVLNGMTKTVSGKVRFEKGKLLWKASFDLGDFDGNEAVEALNAVCSERHTGTDGKSVLWPDVAIKWIVKISEQ